MYTLLQPVQTPLDRQWYTLLHPLTVVPGEIYTYLMPPATVLAGAKQPFLASGKTANPALLPDSQYHDSIVEHMQALQALQARISKEEQNEHIRNLYTARIDELRAHCQLWIAAAAEDQAAYTRANRTLYGTPDAAVHAASCAWLRGIAEAYATHDNAQTRQAAQTVLQLVPDLAGSIDVLQPSEDVFRELLELHNQPGGYIDQLFGGASIAPGSAITPRLGDAIIGRILATLAPDYTIADSDDYWGVRHGLQQVVRPHEYALSLADFTGIVAHEIGSHLLERINGLRSPLQLLGVGLDHYEHGNEGRAFMREQLAAGSVPAAMGHHAWIFNNLKHLGISLGAGVAGSPRPFAEVYAVLEAVYALWTQITDQQAAGTTVQDAAWDLTVRLLKGTNGLGGAYYKDIVYLEGNVRAWQVAAQFPERILQGDKGKFDIANPTHRTHLQALGIIT